ncbi:MAG TPA: hypothetical protein VKR06_00780 [Ktedonosporobacter sp.]|nr:hypothetical protein [Ktedonosporobacter sp.]
MQEFAPREQRREGQAQDDEEIQAYYRPKKAGDTLKEEHPSTFEDEVPPYSYPAQDRETRSRIEERERGQQSQSQQRRQRFSGPDGDAFENGYQPFRQYNGPQQFPWQGRSQRQNPGRQVLRWILLIVFGIALFKVLTVVIPLLLVLMGILAVLILIPILVIVGLIITFMILSGLGIPVGRGRWLMRSGRFRRGGGPRRW